MLREQYHRYTKSILQTKSASKHLYLSSGRKTLNDRTTERIPSSKTAIRKAKDNHKISQSAEKLNDIKSQKSSVKSVKRANA